jgi:hypothetical protein
MQLLEMFGSRTKNNKLSNQVRTKDETIPLLLLMGTGITQYLIRQRLNITVDNAETIVRLIVGFFFLAERKGCNFRLANVLKSSSTTDHVSAWTEAITLKFT